MVKFSRFDDIEFINHGKVILPHRKSFSQQEHLQVHPRQVKHVRFPFDFALVRTRKIFSTIIVT